MTTDEKYLSRTGVDMWDVRLATEIMNSLDDEFYAAMHEWAKHTLTLPVSGTQTTGAEMAEKELPRGSGNGHSQNKTGVSASEKQLHWIVKIGGEKDLTDLTIKHLTATIAVQDVVDRATKGELVTKGEAGKVLDIFFDKSNPLPAKVAAPVAEKVKKEIITEDGMYKLGDRIIKVQKAVHGSGKLYAKELIKDEYDGAVSFSFEYAPGVVTQLTAADKMTLEEAKAFGTLYGVCCDCNKTLTDEKSISEGIGPVCARKFG